ncbi:hypothetical protein VF_2011 [Aliivibrio fischeri ES114]|uniref:Head completion/stabilization protein n=1 Tax=Aliivibrio fischeri (strain ATCC 700601 / ES114) TaxID=312309 RepID=Q5E390_ALIF1|nr:head completion/stabilization protein [Aliivibrio fischeri]AAW86506.1 hypothetical protein VF_2011 [Aliivibrio fischeri ES114]KLU79209.1 hypothetical protein AB192_06645 [Aliivibrio fischeri]
MQFVGNKDEEYASVLPKTDIYPELAISEFQRVFHFLSDETEAGILHNATVARVTVNRELMETITPFKTLDALSMERFGETQTGTLLYKQAVFSLAANAIINNQLSMNATKEAADRQEAIQAKADHALVQYRRAIDLLLNGKETYFFAVV